MKIIKAASGYVFARFAGAIDAFSLRHGVFVIGFLLAAFPYSLTPFSLLDKMSIYIASLIHNSDVGSANIAVVTVPEDEVNAWQKDLYSATHLAALVANVLHSSDAHISVLVDDNIRLSLSEFETAILQDVTQDKGREQLSSGLLQQVQQKAYLGDLLRHERITLGVLDAQKAPKPLHIIYPQKTPAYAMLRWRHAIRDCMFCGQSQIKDLTFSSDVTWVTDDKNTLPRLFDTDSQYLSPSFYANAYFASEIARQNMTRTDMRRDNGWFWNIKNVFGYAEKNLHVSQDGSFIALHSLFSSLSARKIVLNYNEALAASAFPDDVFIVSEKKLSQAYRIADNVYSLRNGAIYYKPWWAELFIRGALCLLTLYFCFIQTRIQSVKRAAIFPAVFMSISLVATIYASVYSHLWLPLAVIFLWCVCAFLLMSVWRFKQNKEHVYQRQRDKALWEASFALEKNQYVSEAISILIYHSNEAMSHGRLCQLSDQLCDKTGDVHLATELLNNAASHAINRKKLDQHIAYLNRKNKQANNALPSVAHASIPEVNHKLPEQFGRYQIKEEIGRGAVGVVFLGYDPAISRQVAIKTLDTRSLNGASNQNLKQRFFREAEAAGRLSHPGIISIYDVGEEGDYAYIAMDYVSGKPLNHYVHSETLLPLSHVYRIIYDIALALDYAHNNQIVHRDIKPSNIMYSVEPYQVKVADFGIARLLDHSKTTTGDIMGSPLYMAPEQLKGSKVEVTADIFSLGVMFYQLLSGHLPFDSDNLASLTYEIIHTRHKNIRSVRKDLPASAIRIVNQCLQKAPQDRYETAMELAGVIKKAMKRDFIKDYKRFDLD